MIERTLASLRRAAAIDALEPRTLLAALDSGVQIGRTISKSSQVDLHTITVTQGYPFLLAVHDTSNSSFTPRVRVLSPSGSTIFDQSSSDGLASIITTGSTGQYTIEISAAAGTGSYSVVAFRPTAPTDLNVTLADSGHRYADTIGGGGDTDFYAIDATVGATVSATASENTPDLAFDPKLTLVAPDGRIVGQQGDEHGVRLEERATKAGRYFATVSDDGGNDSGIFGFTMTRVPGVQYAGDVDTLPLDPGVTRNTDVSAGDADAFELPNIRVGDTITVNFARVAGQDLNPDAVLYDPTGAQVARGTRANGVSTIVATADMAGSYWVVTRDFEADSGGSATFRYDVAHAAGTTRVIEGTGGNDRIIVTFFDNGGSVRVNLNGANTDYDLEPGDRLDIRGNDGDDLIDLRDGDSSNYVAENGVYVTGGSGDDTIYGSIGNDTITGGAGRNRLFGNDGDDRINGSAGRDFIYGEGGNDRLYSQAGNDYIDGGGNVDRVYGGDGDDLLLGGNSNDRIYGQAGTDTLVGGKRQRLPRRRRRRRPRPGERSRRYADQYRSNRVGFAVRTFASSRRKTLAKRALQMRD